jgi:hypothetical protein
MILNCYEDGSHKAQRLWARFTETAKAKLGHAFRSIHGADEY